MKISAIRSGALLSFTTVLALTACSTPTLVEVARRRQVNTDAANQGLRGTRNVQDNVNVVYHVVDLDVLNFTDEIKRKLAARATFHTNVRFGSAGTQATLGALAGAAKVIGWGVSTASGLGLGATYIFGMGQIFDERGHAQAYEQAFTAIQSAEANFYFRQVGMSFKPDDDKPGKLMVDYSGVKAADSANIPRADRLTPDGETLYYRVTKIMKVLEDVLAAKIPDLQDLKDAKGDTTGSTSPTLATESPKTPKAPPAPTPPQSPGASTGTFDTSALTDPAPAAATPAPVAPPAPEARNKPATAANNIPPQLLPRNARLADAFGPLSDADAKKHLDEQGLFAPPGTVPKEYLAKIILADADLPLLHQESALQSLTFYRTHASDEATTSKLEAAYRSLGLLSAAGK